MLANDHVLFQETEAGDKEVLDLEPGLVLVRVLPLNEVRHEESVRNKFQPSKGKCWVALRLQLTKQVCHVKEHLSLSPCIEAVANVDSGQDIDQHPVVGLLIEKLELVRVVLIQFNLDELQQFRHELLLVELKCFEQEHHKLDEAVDEVVVEEGVTRAQLPVLRLLGELDGRTHAHIAKFEEVRGVFLNC